MTFVDTTVTFFLASQNGEKSHWIFLNYGYLPEAADYVEGLNFLRLMYSSENLRLYETR